MSYNAKVAFSQSLVPATDSENDNFAHIIDFVLITRSDGSRVDSIPFVIGEVHLSNGTTGVTDTEAAKRAVEALHNKGWKITIPPQGAPKILNWSPEQAVLWTTNAKVEKENDNG